MRYTKKPEYIDAIQWDGTEEGIAKICVHFPGLVTTGIYHPHENTVISWDIKGGLGTGTVPPGKYVYRDEDGMFWTMSQDQLDAGYDKSEAD